ncbi:MAG: hypothetical protein RJA07_322 [Bacteroidota bacterium]|jgi:multidrug efflux pump subunit AcrA (membrane-fusion protein)
MKFRLLILVCIAVIYSCKQTEIEIKPEIKSLTEAVYASGVLVSENDYKLISLSDGFLIHSFVKEGDEVKANQILFQLQSSTRNIQMQSAEDLMQKTIPITAANAPLFSDLKNKIELAKSKYLIDSINFVRYQNLYQQNATTKTTVENFELKFKSSAIELNSLKIQLNQLKLSSALTLQQSQNQLNVAKNEIINTQIKNIVAGTVYDIYKNEGDLILPNQPVALIGSGKLIARLSVDETDLNKIKTNQKVLITMDAYPNRVFKATITKIYPSLNRIEQSIKVDAIFDEALPANFYGLNVEANIVVNENKQVLVIPKQALLSGDSVWIKKETGKLKVKIKKGIEDKEFVEIISGITSSNIIIEKL